MAKGRFPGMPPMGGNMGGIRVGGTTGYQSAFQVVGSRKYRDFRNDKVIDNRQFQVALRKLRQFSARLDIPKTELDIDGTIDATCNNGGCLQIVMEKPICFSPYTNPITTKM